MSDLSILDIDHMLRCKVENLLDSLDGIDNEQFDIIQIAFEDAVERITDELFDLEERYASEEEWF